MRYWDWDDVWRFAVTALVVAVLALIVVDVFTESELDRVDRTPVVNVDDPCRNLKGEARVACADHELGRIQE